MQNKFWEIVNKIADFMFKIWSNKVGDFIKLNVLWGIIIILIGDLVNLNELIALGLVMCCGFALFVLLTCIFFVFVGTFELIWKLFSYTERVIFDKNRIFVD